MSDEPKCRACGKAGCYRCVPPDRATPTTSTTTRIEQDRTIPSAPTPDPRERGYAPPDCLLTAALTPDAP